MSYRAVFLDRDGTIARDAHYCRRPEDFEMLPTVPEAVRLLNENDFRVVVVTNQSGLARGYFTVDALSRIHAKMRNELARGGARVDAIYYCPHHPDDGCECRKPRTALFERAASDLNLDLKRSFMVGDTAADINAGQAVGAVSILVTTGPDTGTGITCRPALAASDLLEAASWIVVSCRSGRNQDENPMRL